MYITFRCMAGGAWEPHRKRSAWKRPSGCCGWCKWSGRHSDRWRRIYITLWSRPTHRVTLSRALSVVINVISPSLPLSFRRTEDQQASWRKARVLMIGALERVHNPLPPCPTKERQTMKFNRLWVRDVVLGTCTRTRTCHLELQVLIQVHRVDWGTQSKNLRSHGGLIMTLHRCRMADKTLSSLVFLKCNIRFSCIYSMWHCYVCMTTITNFHEVCLISFASLIVGLCTCTCILGTCAISAISRPNAYWQKKTKTKK